MYLVIAKLVEVLARAGFTVAATFLLPLAAAGQFGIIATLIGLFAFAFGWERYIDIQRRFVGLEPHLFDRAVIHAFQLWGVNYLLLMPIFLLVAAEWAAVGPWTLALCAAIVIGEHIANQVYNLSVVEPRYARLVGLVAAKNLAALGLVLYQLLGDPTSANLEDVLISWAAVSVVSSLLIVVLWMAQMDRRPFQQPFRFRDRILAQHKASLTHFGIGMLGVLMLQFDRLAVGSLLPLDDVGVYFRHILLVSFAYQLFNIASYNRKVPMIFKRAKTHDVADARRIVHAELAKVVALVLLGLGIVWVADRLTEGVWTRRYSVRLDLAAMLVLGALLRIAADYSGLILNSRMRENTLLRLQLVSFGLGATLLMSFTYSFGLFGTAAATVANSTVYYILTRQAVSRLQEHTRHDHLPA